jgi:hypothetical protein
MQAATPPSVGGPPPVAQHGWPAPPHAAHIPAIPCPALRPAQPKPELQVPPKPQQIWPSPPHVSQVPAPASVRPWQARLVDWQLPPPQQGCPEPPQLLLQVPPLKPPFGLSHVRPLLHIWLGQQGCPDAPQAMHIAPPASAPALMQPSEASHWFVPP